MGMDRTVILSSVPAYADVLRFLTDRGFEVQTRMIDGELSFPDEQPPDAWREVRVGTPLGMVTLRRIPEGVVFVTWGNADEAMRQAWNALIWAYTSLGGGTVQTPEGTMDADTFRHNSELPPMLKD